MLRALILAAALAAAPAASADPPEGADAAAALIERAGAEGVFEPIASEPGVVVVRHPRSGLVCRLRAGGANRLVVFPQAARGEDVACETADGRETITLYATRYSFEASLDEHVAAVEAALRQRFPDAQPVPASLAVASDTLPPHGVRQFLIVRDGVRTFTSASVAQIGAWTVKLRYSLAAPDDEAVRQGELNAHLAFAAALREIIAPAQP